MVKRAYGAIMIVSLFFVLSTYNTAHASWAKAFGYPDSSIGSVWPGADCNYYFWLTTGESTSRKLYFSELDSSGNPRWTKMIYGNGTDDLMILQLADGGYFIYGTTESVGAGGKDILWEKFDASWNKVYGNTFGGTKDENGGPNFTDDGGFLISGTTESYLPDGSDKDMLLIKVNSSGTIEWSKVIHHGLKDGSPGITEVSDGYLFTASVENTSVPGTPGQDILIVKLNKSGTIQWKKLYQGSIETGAWVNSVSAPQEVTGGYLLWGSTKLYSSSVGDILLIKIDNSGDIRWQKKYYDETSSQTGNVYSVRENTDGTFLFDGLVMNVGDYINPYDILLMKLTSTGDISWKKTLIGPGYDVASLTETSDGNYLLSGSTSNYTQQPFDPGNILYAKLGINLTNGSITYPWGSAKTFGSTGFESGGVYEYFDQYALFGYTQSWGVGSMNALGVFFLDVNGTLPGCQYFQDVTLTEGTANLSVSDTTLTTLIPTLTERPVGTSGPLNLTVATATSPTVTDICSATTLGTYSIAGTITYNGTALTGVTITLTGTATKTTTTDKNGDYNFTGLSSGTYTITPSKTGYTFTPASKSVTTSCAVQLGVNFTATQSAGGGCNIWSDVIDKYSQYVNGQAGWADVISCYNDYVTPSLS